MRKDFLHVCLVVLAFGLFSAGIESLTSLGKISVSDSKWRWIRKLSFPDTAQTYDYVFAGSSHIWQAVKPRNIETELGVKAINIGRNWDGKDADFYSLKNLLQNNHVKNVVLELYAEEAVGPHEYFPYIVDAEDLGGDIAQEGRKISLIDVLTLSSAFKHFINQSFQATADLVVRAPTAIINHLLGRLDCSTEACQKNDGSAGFYFDDPNLRQEPAFYEKWKDQRFELHFHEGRILEGSRAAFYVRKIKGLTDKYGAKLQFLYVPSYMGSPPGKNVVAFYRQFGPVLVPRLEPLYKIEYWTNSTHLFHEGSEVFTQNVIELLKHGPAASAYAGQL